MTLDGSKGEATFGRSHSALAAFFTSRVTSGGKEPDFSGSSCSSKRGSEIADSQDGFKDSLR